jgi:hypothetical protein
MHPPRFTIGQLLLIVAAFSIGLAALKGNDLRGISLSMLMIIGLLGAALGACWPRPNTRVTKGKLRGQDFAEWARDEAKEAESRVKERGTS